MKRNFDKAVDNSIWQTAPFWAEWLAMDENGKWFWHDYEPKKGSCTWVSDGLHKSPLDNYFGSDSPWDTTLRHKWDFEEGISCAEPKPTDNTMTEEQYNTQQGISYTEPKSVCAWELKFSFTTEKQTKNFIKLLLDSGLDLNFEYYTDFVDTKRHYAVCVTGNWADTLTEVSRLLETVDHEGV